MTASVKPWWNRREIDRLFRIPVRVAPPIISVALGWLLVELGVHRWVALIAAVVSFVGGVMAAVAVVMGMDMNNNPRYHQPPSSAVRYFLGRAVANLSYLVVGSVAFAAVFLVGRLSYLIATAWRGQRR